MINMNIIWGLITENKELTTKQLNDNGIKSNDITKLVKKDTLERISRGKYKIKNVDVLYGYGKDLLLEGKKAQAQECFRKCYEIDQNHLSSCFQMFYQCVYNEKYEEAYHYLRQMMRNKEKYINDHKLYLCLLSNLIELPKDDIYYTKLLEIDDVLIDDNDKRFAKKDLKVQNKIRYFVLENKFNIASFYAYKSRYIHATNSIMYKLICDILAKERAINNTILGLIEANEYEKIINIIENEQNKHRISRVHDVALEICNNIVAMINDGSIFHPQNDHCEFDLAGTIYCNKYEKAIKILKTKRKQEELDKDIVYKLLIEAVKIKNKIIKEDEYLFNSIKLLNRYKTFVLLDALSTTQKQKLFKLLENDTSVIISKFDIDDEERILLKYNDAEYDETLDSESLFHEAQELYNNKKYEQSLEIYLKLLRIFEKPKSFIYAKIGNLYYKLSQHKKAKMAYFIADIVARQEENDFTRYEKHGKKYPYSKQTINIKMRECDFYDDMSDHYGIKEYEDIFALIQEDGMSIDEACSKFNLSDEDKNIIKLVAARNYYSQKNFKKGDKILTQVERSTDKTPFLNTLINEIKTNKKLYQYRNSVINKQLVK